MKESRIEWIDIAKGIGIILVIAGHTIYLGYSYPIYAFHMPLFFFLSGLVLKDKKEGFVNFWKTKTKSLIRPWFVILTISLFVCLTIPEWRNQLTLKAVLSDLYTANTNVFQNSSLWYLVCFYFVLILFYFINKIKVTRVTKFFFYLFAIVLLWSKEVLNMTNLPFHRLPFKIDSALIALFFFILAFRYKEKILKLMACKYNLLIVSVVIVFTICLCVFNGWSNINSLDTGKVRLLYYPIALMGIGSVCLISQLQGWEKLTKTRKFFVFYGKNSLIIFGFQSLFIRLYLLFFNRVQNLNMVLYDNNPIYHQIGSFILVSFVLSPIVTLLFTFLRKKGIRIV